MENGIFEEIQKQFMVSLPMNIFSWKGILEILQNDMSTQKQLLDSTINNPLIEKFPIKFAYQRKFLKHIIDQLETKQCEVIDEIYNSYCELISKENIEQKSHYRHYVLPSCSPIPRIVLQESTSLLSSGTTGLSSWQAGVTLAEWCLSNKSLLAGRCVLELGSGCGLTGLVVAAASSASQVLLTDGHEAVTEQLWHNVKINATDHEITEQQRRASIGHTNTSVMLLPWSQIPSCTQLPPPHVILAADVVFDPNLFEELKDAIIHLLTLNRGKSKAVLACTLRNEETLNNFLQLLTSSKLNVTKEEEEPAKVFCYDRLFPVYIYTVKLEDSS